MFSRYTNILIFFEMNYKTISLAIVIALNALTLFSCKKNNDTGFTGFGSVELDFDHKIGSASLELETGNYLNANGDDFKVIALKYYLSNFSLTKADGSVVLLPESYLFVDASIASTTLQELKNVPAGDYTKINFTIGVDSLRNYTTSHTGVFDHSNGMFIDNNNGFIFLKLEGTSTKSALADNKLYYQISGAKPPISAIRKTSLSLHNGILKVRENTKPEMHLIVDPSFMFKGANIINFGLMPITVGEDALIIANNYAMGMFVVDHIHN